MIVRKTRDLSQEEFGRRRLVHFDGVSLWVSSAEDMAYSEKWIQALNLKDEWNTVRRAENI